MMPLKKNEIAASLKEIGICEGDIVLVHSSLKSLGPLQDGAETVISGFLQAVGDKGTLVMPAFTQKDFANAYNTWYIDKESDTGYLTNYLRRRYGSCRSDQATHSVTATGLLAQTLTKTHGQTGKRCGDMGDTPFAKDSPWEKMYNLGAKVVLLGVSPLYITYRHYAEYCFIEKCLERLERRKEYNEMKQALADHNKSGVWPHTYNIVIADRLDKMGLVRKTICGEAVITKIDVVPFVDNTIKWLSEFDNEILWRIDEVWDTDAYIEWTKKYRDIIQV